MKPFKVGDRIRLVKGIYYELYKTPFEGVITLIGERYGLHLIKFDLISHDLVISPDDMILIEKNFIVKKPKNVPYIKENI